MTNESNETVLVRGFKLSKVCAGRWSVRRGRTRIGAIMQFGDHDFQVVDRRGHVLADHIKSLERAVREFER